MKNIAILATLLLAVIFSGCQKTEEVVVTPTPPTEAEVMEKQASEVDDIKMSESDDAALDKAVDSMDAAVEDLDSSAFEAPSETEF